MAGSGTHCHKNGKLKMPKSPLAATAAGRGKKMLKSFLVAVLLSASVEKFFVSRMRDFFCYFAFELVFISPRMESKRYLVNKNTSCVSSGIGALWLPENKTKILKPKICYDLQVFWSNSLDVYSNDIVCLLKPILKPMHNISRYEKIRFSLKI